MDGRVRAGVRGWTAGAAGIAVALVGLLVVGPGTAFGATADLSVDLTDSADPVNQGSEFSYEIRVTNGGPESANGVELVDTLANELDVAGSNPSQGSCDLKGKKLSCQLGTIANGATATVSVRVSSKKVGQVVNEVSVSTADVDPVTANDRDTETTTIVEPPPAPTCAGQPATVLGTEGDDSLTGTSKKDVFVALGGNDVILGLGGNDLVCAAAGNDVVKGAAGDDEIRAGGGSDVLKGGDGRDGLRGGGGSDRLAGGAGADSLRGGGGKDVCRSGPGKDVERSC